MLSDIDQQLPHEIEWKDFPDNSKNKSQLINLLVDYVFGDDFHMNGNICYYKELICPSSQCNGLIWKHKDGDLKVVFHAMFESGKGKNVCVVADVYILLLFVGNQFMSQVYFRQGKHSDKSDITYHDKVNTVIKVV